MRREGGGYRSPFFHLNTPTIGKKQAIMHKILPIEFKTVEELKLHKLLQLLAITKTHI
jgi:hypothetical protein